MDDFDQECINDFIEETAENLDVIDQSFLELEKDPKNQEVIDNVFRAIHTIKGGCRLINFKNLEGISHSAENMLDIVRSGDLILGPNHISLLLKANDIFRYFLDHLKEKNTEATQKCQLLIDQINAACEGKKFLSDELAIETILNTGNTITETAIKDATPSDSIQEVKIETESESTSVPQPDNKEKIKPEVEHAEKEEQQKGKEELNALEKEWGMGEDSIKQPVTEENSQAAVAVQKKALPTMSSADIDIVENKAQQGTVEASETIRIDIKRLDSLMNLVGELVLSRNQLKQVSLNTQDTALISTANSISLITSELQEEIVKSRLQPISLLLSKFQRTVRDMARELGKEVKLTITGGNTELDRTLLESIKDPLTHLLRNSVDHGIEMPHVREAKDKPALGNVQVSCSHEGGLVIIDIIDDGGGLDPEKIGLKALEKGLISKDELKKSTKKDILDFIFNPGFSTAEKVTNISGRGVGMDVVKTNITSIGGQIELESEVNKGTTIHLQIPLTLAIIPALIVSSSDQKFAVPQVNLQELLLIEKKDAHKIEKFNNMEVYRLRGNLLPLLRLRTMLGYPENKNNNKFYIVVLMSGEQQYGLIVDQVDDTEEIVVKPLAKFFQNVSLYSGASIMGDGTISLILDIEALGKCADIQANKKNTMTTNLNRAKVASTALTFSLGGDEVFGVQMSQISRLEEIKLSEIEYSGDQEVIQYRGDILPIVRLSNVMEIEEVYESESVNLIVFDIAGKEAALLVRDIIDSVNLEGELDNAVIEHPLILGTMILRNQVVLLLDAVKVFKTSFTKWHNQDSNLLPAKKQRILYVDDSPFYLKVVKRYLNDSGYDITTCQDSIESLNIIKANEFDLFIFDYEMPGMDGKELTEKVRKIDRFNFTPIIILTALTGGDEKKSIINSGIQNYLVKLNKEELLSEIGKLLTLDLVEA